MSFCLTELHLWSMKNTLQVKDVDIGTFQYHDRKESVPSIDCCYLEEKQRMTEAHEYLWTPKNKRPDKLRDTLKEFEELLQCTRCVLSKWKNKSFCQLFFGSGVLVSLSLCGPHLEKILIDKTLVGKLISDTINDAVLADSFMIITFLETSKLCFVQFTKKQSSPDVNKKMEKFSTSDLKLQILLQYAKKLEIWKFLCDYFRQEEYKRMPFPMKIQKQILHKLLLLEHQLNDFVNNLLKVLAKISYIDLPGPKGCRVERHLAINCVQDMVICWWQMANGDGWPWFPIANESDRANVVLLSCINGKLEVLSFTRTEGDPLDAGFSINQPNQVHTVECSVNPDKEPMADSCIYECARNKLQRVAVISIPLRSKATCCSRNITEDKLVLGCEDSSVILYDAYRRVTLLAHADFVPSMIEWHPDGAVIIVGSYQGEIQCYDMALSPIKMQLLAEDIKPVNKLQFSQYFAVTSRMVQIQWTVPQVIPPNIDNLIVHDLLFLRFDKGPVGVLYLKLGVLSKPQLGPTELICQYIRYEQIEEAINVLLGMNWNTAGLQCYNCLIAIVDHLLKQKLTSERESQLEAALGTFYAPTRPLSDTTVLEYRDPISQYARRFFHHLLRYQRFEKAFLLAVDIGSRDLFMDIYYVALDKSEMALAEVAKKKANEIDVESMTSEVVTLECAQGGDSLRRDGSEFPSVSMEAERPKNGNSPHGSASNSSYLPQHAAQSSPYIRPSCHNLRGDTESELEFNTYGSGLIGDPSAWIQAGNTSGGGGGGEAQELGKNSTLKVVHFGLV